MDILSNFEKLSLMSTSSRLVQIVLKFPNSGEFRVERISSVFRLLSRTEHSSSPSIIIIMQSKWSERPLKSLQSSSIVGRCFAALLHFSYKSSRSAKASSDQAQICLIREPKMFDNICVSLN